MKNWKESKKQTNTFKKKRETERNSRPNLDKSRDRRTVTVTIAGLHVEISSGASAQLAGGLHRLDLRRLSSLSVEVALPDDFPGGGDHAAEVGVRRRESGRFVGDLSGTSHVERIERVGMVVVGGGFADDGRREGRRHWCEGLASLYSKSGVLANYATLLPHDRVGNHRMNIPYPMQMIRKQKGNFENYTPLFLP